MYDTGGPLAIRHLKRYAADKFDDYSKIMNVRIVYNLFFVYI